MVTRLNDFLVNDLIKYKTNLMTHELAEDRIEEVNKIVQSNYIHDLICEEDFKMCMQLIETYRTYYRIERTYNNTI